VTPAGALCTACGACCNGTLFDEVPLARDEVALGPRLRLRIVAIGDEACMALPCPRLEVATCTIYPDRPSTCRSYKCGLLEDLEHGRVDEATAHQRVEALRVAALRVRELLPGGLDKPVLRAFQELADQAGGRRSAPFMEGHAELIARVDELGVAMRRVTRTAKDEGPE
jgi:hypothetical protein